MLLHIADHLFAAIHAEVDVEVGHRHPFRVQEAFEQQRIAQGVKVGDGQHIGHQTARTRAPAGPHGDVVLLGPFDEIGHDQEVTGEAHLLDNVDFELQPRFILFARGGQFNHRKTLFQPLPGLTAQLFHLVIGKARQDRLALGRHEGAAAGDFDGVLQRLGQVGKERTHLCFGFEIVLRRQAAARLLLIDIGPFGNADQGVMRLIHLGLGKIDVVGRHQRQAHLIGEFDMAAFRPRLGLGQLSALAGMALQLDIKTVRIDGRQTLQQGAGLGPLTGRQKPAQGPVRPAGQADQPSGILRQLVQRDLWQLPALADVKARVQLHQVHVARFGLGQQDNGRGVARLFARRGGIMGKADLATHDGLQPGILGQNRKLQRREHVVGVGDRNRRHLHADTGLDQFLHRHRAFQQRVFGVNAQMNESRGCHGHSLSALRPGRKGRRLSGRA